MDLPEVVLAVDPAGLGPRAAGAGSARLTPAMRLCTPYCRGRTNSSGVSREPAWLAAQGARFPKPGSLSTVPAERAALGFTAISFPGLYAKVRRNIKTG